MGVHAADVEFWQVEGAYTYVSLPASRSLDAFARHRPSFLNVGALRREAAWPSAASKQCDCLILTVSVPPGPYPDKEEQQVPGVPSDAALAAEESAHLAYVAASADAYKRGLGRRAVEAYAQAAAQKARAASLAQAATNVKRIHLSGFSELELARRSAVCVNAGALAAIDPPIIVTQPPWATCPLFHLTCTHFPARPRRASEEEVGTSGCR
jgi:hypothetical protein